MKDDRLISLNAALDTLNGIKITKGANWYEYYQKALTAVGELPPAQPQRMRGEWIDVTKTGNAGLWKCSECGELELEDSYFCPNCGADMRGENGG